MDRAKQLGQYFTPAFVADFMIDLAGAPLSAKVLEPAAGEGVFLQGLASKGYSNVLGLEVDKSLQKDRTLNVKYASFVSTDLESGYDLIIGNPPYVRWKNLNADQKNELFDNRLWNAYCNSLCDYLYIFILKSIELLKPGGELIFITPEYWINTMHAQKLRDHMVEQGYFTDLIHFSETPIFNKVASSILIFKFIKAAPAVRRPQVRVVKYMSTRKLKPEDLLNLKQGQGDESESFSRHPFKKGEAWTLAPESVLERISAYETKCHVVYGQSLFGEEKKYFTLGNIADIGNGLVSGLDKAFQLPPDIKLNAKESVATLTVIKAKSMQQYVHGDPTRYIFVTDIKPEALLKKSYPHFYERLKAFEDKLNERYQYGRQINYWEWVFPRSLNLFNRPQPRIFVPCKERISHKQHFRFCYAGPGIYPTQDVTAILLKPATKESLYYLLALLNSDYVFEWLKYKGVVKGNIVEFSERPLASIPIRLIDWDNPAEVKLHNKISNLCQRYIETGDMKLEQEAQQKLNRLL